MSGATSPATTGEHRAGAPETGEDFIEDQQQIVFVGGRAQTAQCHLVMKDHPAGALHQWLYQNAGQFFRMAFEERVEGGDALFVARQIDDVMLGQQTGEQRMHAFFGIAHRHRSKGVAVIAALEGEEFRASADAFVQPILGRHLHGDFHGHRA